MDNCVICNEPIEGYGNNAAPVSEGRCCDKCHWEKVVPARFKHLGFNSDEPKAEDAVEEVKEKRNPLAIDFSLKDKVRYYESEEIAEIMDYDENGLYVLVWANDGAITKGIGDKNLTLVEKPKATDSAPKVKLVLKKVKR